MRLPAQIAIGSAWDDDAPIRSPLLPFHLIAWTGFFTFFAGKLEVTTVAPNSPIWQRAGQVGPVFVQVGFILFSLFVGVLVAMEISIKRGWEPEWLESTWLGATLIDKFPDHKNLHLGVRLGDREEYFLCDREEFDGIEVGDVVHLRVIGHHVSRYTKVEKEDVNLEPVRILHQQRFGCLFLYEVGTKVFLAGMLFWFGIFGFLTAEISWIGYSRRSDPSAGGAIGRFPAQGVYIASTIAILLGCFLLRRWMRWLRDGGPDPDRRSWFFRDED